MKKNRVLSGLVIIILLTACSAQKQIDEERLPSPPLDMESLKNIFSYVRGESESDKGWPRTVKYKHKAYDLKTDIITEEEKTFEIKSKPYRIIPHSVGVAEILWAICPRERIIIFNELSADPEFSFIAAPVKKRGSVFKSNQTELVIGYKPDLVFTVFYSDTTFKDKLKQARIPYFDLGYFGTIESIKHQISLIGNIIGEEGNARALVRIMDEKIQELKSKIPATKSPVRVLFYDEGGYIPGKSSNFNSICGMVGVVNVGAEEGVKSWSQIDYETLLKWNPDIILVPQGSNIKNQLLTNKILSHAGAVKKGKVFSIPAIYLRVDSQFMILSANLLAGIVYEKSF